MFVRCQQEKNQSELTSLTEQLTECELTIEEWDLKLVALEAQLKCLQTQIKVHQFVQYSFDCALKISRFLDLGGGGHLSCMGQIVASLVN